MKAINKDILKLAVPSILANITVPLVGMADIAIAGHLEADAAHPHRRWFSISATPPSTPAPAPPAR